MPAQFRPQPAVRPRPPNREYYRKLQRSAHTFRVDLPRKKWCNLWHTHLDWDGFGNLGPLHRRRHLAALFHAFRMAQRELAAQPMPYQIFLNISLRDSASDAIYVHTPNPHATEFPLSFDECAFLTHAPPLLAGRVDLDRYRICRKSHGKDVWYLVIPKPYEVSHGMHP
jgi:hypothetical protein